MARHRKACLQLSGELQDALMRHSGPRTNKVKRSSPRLENVPDAEPANIEAMITAWQRIAWDCEQSGDVKNLATSHEMLLTLFEKREKSKPAEKGQDFSGWSLEALQAAETFYSILSSTQDVEAALTAVQALRNEC